MKIAITGTRGVPNHYGGFEQFAEHLSEYLVKDGHEVTVYNSHTHPYQSKEWKGVKIRHCHDPENRFGTIGQFFYDLNCIRDCRRRDYDIILQLGYTSNSIWGFLLPRGPVIITNMDGMEWKRSKYSKSVQKFLRWAEKLAVKTSDFLISDSIGIQDYLLQKYRVRSQYIPYGASLFEDPEIDVLAQYGVEKYEYDMLIARLEPENNIETILEGVTAATGCTRSFLVIGNHHTAYGAYLKEKFGADERIIFTGAIFEKEKLHSLKSFSWLYFHGHSTGGTNPSLLEAMASRALILAHENAFNRNVLGGDAYYFSSAGDVAGFIEAFNRGESEVAMTQRNYEKVVGKFTWPAIVTQYERFILQSLFLFRNERNILYRRYSRE